MHPTVVGSTCGGAVGDASPVPGRNQLRPMRDSAGLIISDVAGTSGTSAHHNTLPQCATHS